MQKVIDLEGLPEPVAMAIAETVRNLKNSYPAARTNSSTQPRKLTQEEADLALDELLDTLPPMPSLSDAAVSRESMKL